MEVRGEGVTNFRITTHATSHRWRPKRTVETDGDFYVLIEQANGNARAESFVIHGYVGKDGRLTVTVDAKGGTRLKRVTSRRVWEPNP